MVLLTAEHFPTIFARLWQTFARRRGGREHEKLFCAERPTTWATGTCIERLYAWASMSWRRCSSTRRQRATRRGVSGTGSITSLRQTVRVVGYQRIFLCEPVLENLQQDLFGTEFTHEAPPCDDDAGQTLLTSPLTGEKFSPLRKVVTMRRRVQSRRDKKRRCEPGFNPTLRCQSRLDIARLPLEASGSRSIFLTATLS